MRTLHTLACVVPAAAAIALAACSTQAAPPRLKVFPSDATIVQVRNNGFSDAVVYVVRAGTRMRLGFVRGHTEETFRLPAQADLSAPLQLVARPIAGDAYRIPAVAVSPGQRVEVTLHSQQRLSDISVWNR